MPRTLGKKLLRVLVLKVSGVPPRWCIALVFDVPVLPKMLTVTLALSSDLVFCRGLLAREHKRYRL